MLSVKKLFGREKLCWKEWLSGHIINFTNNFGFSTGPYIRTVHISLAKISIFQLSGRSVSISKLKIFNHNGHQYFMFQRDSLELSVIESQLGCKSLT